MREGEARARRVAEARRGTGSWQAGCCPVAKLLERGLVEAGSVDVVFTDPPYPREYLHTWSELGQLAASALRPGGVLTAVSGQSWLPDVFGALDVPGLEYRWTSALRMPGSHVQIWPRHVFTQWKPVLVFQRAGGSPRWLKDVFDAPPRQGQADAFHTWGQSPDAMDVLAAALLQPGDRVLDPFAGGGETALAAWRLGCHVAAFDAAPDVAVRLASVTESVTARAA